jgi:hypothetical protein
MHAPCSPTSGRILQIATANVCTLNVSKYDHTVLSAEGLNALGRAQLLESQFEAHDLDVICIQEGRTVHDQIRSGAIYDMYIAGALDGSYGSQIWIKKSIRAEVIMATAISPRIMTVAARLRGQQPLAIIAAHAPCLMSSPAVRGAFWCELARAASAMRARWPSAAMVVGIDANARVGSIMSPYIGALEVDPENDNGACLRYFLDQLELYAHNTFVKAGHTWTSGHGTTARIDYICTSVMPPAPACVLDTIELATSAREDHRVVASSIVLQKIHDREPPPPAKFSVNLANTHVPWRCRQFEDAMWAFPKDDKAFECIDGHLDFLLDYIKSAAKSAFGPPLKVPRQPWVTPSTWALLSRAAPLRRSMHFVRSLLRTSCLRVFLLAWKWTTQNANLQAPYRETFTAATMDATASARTRDGVRALEAARQEGAQLRRVEAAAHRTLALLHHTVKRLVAADKRAFLDDMALRAASAAEHNDSKTAFKIIRLLGGFQPRRLKSVRLKDGSLAHDAAQAAARWEEHFVELFAGASLPQPALAATEPMNVVPIQRFRPSLTDVASAIARTGTGKAVGPDEVPAELLKAGGCAIAVCVHPLIDRIVVSQRWPWRWKGGRVATLWKKKGDYQVCDNSRGLLVMDHIGKILPDLIKNELAPTIAARLPASQYGGVEGGGTDFPNHTLRLLVEYAKVASLSLFILFVDLSQAFDRVVREVVCGWPQQQQGVSDATSDAERLAYLLSIGVNEAAAQHIVRDIRLHGTVLERWEVDPVVAELIRGLHSMAWFQVDGRPSVVATSTGGRQGCKLGGLIFAICYEQALSMMREALVTAGIAIKFKYSSDLPFWSPADEAASETADPLVEVTFVDDEAIGIIASTPAALDVAIDVIVSSLRTAFAAFNLTINWKPGKSEAMLRYRGRHASKRLDARRSAAGLGIGIDDGNTLHLVSEYKHLGGIIAMSGAISAEAAHRASSAMSAYGPLAGKIFGAESIPTPLKLAFLRSLVLSRLLYNVHTLTMTAVAMTRLNGPYMRALRSIAGVRRFDAACAKSDLEVRRALGAPSIDFVLLRRRIGYYCRIAAGRPLLLWALLQSRPRGQPLPYAAQVQSDLAACYRMSAEMRHELPDPSSDPGAWLAFVSRSPSKACNLIDLCTFVNSMLDNIAHDMPTGIAQFPCELCPPPRPGFSSAKALASHMRARHGARSPIKRFVDDSALCPACGASFCTRIRVIAHLSDARRPACRVAIMIDDTHLVPLSLFQKLEARDKVLRREALQSGHTHPIASGSARCGAGRRIGFVTR